MNPLKSEDAAFRFLLMVVAVAAVVIAICCSCAPCSGRDGSARLGPRVLERLRSSGVGAGAGVMRRALRSRGLPVDLGPAADEAPSRTSEAVRRPVVRRSPGAPAHADRYLTVRVPSMPASRCPGTSQKYVYLPAA